MTTLAAFGPLWLGAMIGFFTCACLTAGKLGDRG